MVSSGGRAVGRSGVSLAGSPAQSASRSARVKSVLSVDRGLTSCYAPRLAIRWYGLVGIVRRILFARDCRQQRTIYQAEQCLFATRNYHFYSDQLVYLRGR